MRWTWVGVVPLPLLGLCCSDLRSAARSLSAAAAKRSLSAALAASLAASRWARRASCSAGCSAESSPALRAAAEPYVPGCVAGPLCAARRSSREDLVRGRGGGG